MNEKLIKKTARKMFYIANRALPKTCVQKWSNLDYDSAEAFIRLAKWHLRISHKAVKEAQKRMEV